MSMARSTSFSSNSRKTRHHNPLSDDIALAGPLRAKPSKRKAKSEEDEDKYVDSRSSRKILKIGQELVDEEEREANLNIPNPAFAFDSRFGVESETDEDAADQEEEAWRDEDDEAVEEIEIDPNDLDLFNKFVPDGPPDPILPSINRADGDGDGHGTNLAELILEKIAAHEAAQAEEPVVQGGGPPEDAVELPAKVVEVYSKIGLLLSRYKSGKLPKPFKILPTLPHWESLLSLTRPGSWSPNAHYEATKIFTSAAPALAQAFLETVLLDRVRADIHESKKLNVHLYKAVQKALYKPAAFFKGFLFPLVQDGSCTLREAHIISSVLVRRTIPVLHSAAALLRLTEIAAQQTSVATESAGATNIFIRVLLEKKYALPYKVIDSLVFHFLRFRPSPSPAIIPAGPPGLTSAFSSGGAGAGAVVVDTDQRLATKDVKLPVLWHQCLLAFAQRYRNDITEDQREALLDLLLARSHRDIGPEIRRELLEGRGRGVVLEDGAGVVGEGGDDTMVMG